MAIAKAPEMSLRLEPREYSRLGWAFSASAVVHALLFAIWLLFTTGKLQWLADLLPKSLKSQPMLTELFKKKEPPRPPESQEIPVVFVDVSPQQASPEPPKKTPYYSDKNSRAANPEPAIDTETPKIDGKRTEIVKTEDVPKNKTFPLQPALPVEQSNPAQEEQKPKPTYTPGDLALAKPEQTTKKDPGDAPKERPRRLEQVKAAQPNNRLVGEKMKQEGSVNRRALQSSLDVTATEFGAYDAAIISAVQNRWYDLLNSRNFAGERTGKVTLRFRLNADGSISEVGFVENTVDLALGLLCQSAIKDPAPFPPWPSDMRRKIGDSFREVTFTFLYY
jgi:hypothetical protein